MNLEKLRLELLAEHEALRERLAQICELARAIEKGNQVTEVEGQLRKALLTLRDELTGHSAREDKVLGPIIRNIDAWGKERGELLEREHAAAHKALFTVLDNATLQVGALRLADAATRMCQELGEHMEEEEKYLLHPEVLTEEIVKVIQLTD